MAWTALLLVIAALLSAVRFVTLSQGGAVTFLSLLPLWLVTFFYGPRHGLAAGFVYGFVRLAVIGVTGEWVNYAPGAIILEYPIACGVFALGGLLCDRRVGVGEDGVPRDAFGLRAGYLVGLLLMGACYVASALLFYPPDAEGILANLVSCIVYDMSYLLIEGLLTELLLCVPAVVEAVHCLREIATTPMEDPTLESF